MMKKQIITIAGGGSTYTPGIVQAILNNEKRLPLSEIRLYDIDEERNMDMYLIVKFMLKRKGFQIFAFVQRMIQSLLLQNAILFSHKFVLEDWRCEKRTKRFHLNMD